MPTTKTIELFTYDELEDSAKETAKQWWLECRDASDFEYVIDDFVTIVEMLGFSVKTHTVQLMGGGTRQAPNVWWSLGYCQSDHAGFEGSYSHKTGSAAAVKKYAPKDEDLHAIVDALTVLQRGAGYQLQSCFTFSDRRGYEATTDYRSGAFTNYEQDKEFVELLKGLSRWLYSRLRAEDEFQTSDEMIEEAMEANGYTFRENGERED